MRSQISLRINADERRRLADYAIANDCPSLSAALRHALPRRVFPDPVKEGRPLGYSPKRNEKDDYLKA
jgi:hypothetical protein